MHKRSLRYIISFIILVLFCVCTFAGCRTHPDKDKENASTEDGLQEKEDEGIDSGKFENIFSDKSDDDKQNVSQDSTTNSDSNNNGNNDNQDNNDNNDNNGNSSSVTKPKPPAQEDSDQEDKVEDNNQNEQDNDAPIVEEEDKEQGWGPII